MGWFELGDNFFSSGGHWLKDLSGKHDAGLQLNASATPAGLLSFPTMFIETGMVYPSTKLMSYHQ